MQQTNQKISNSEYETLISKTLNTNFIKEKTIVNGKVISIDSKHIEIKGGNGVNKYYLNKFEGFHECTIL